MVPRHGHSVGIQAGGDPVEEIGPVHVVLDVFLARPDDLDRTIDLLGDLDGANDAVDVEPPAESAADEVVVYDDLVQRHSGDLRRRGLRARDGLRADPDFALVLAHVDRAIHRLHRGVRQERHLVGRLDLRGSARHGLVGIADVLRNRAWIARCGFRARARCLPW